MCVINYVNLLNLASNLTVKMHVNFGVIFKFAPQN